MALYVYPSAAMTAGTDLDFVETRALIPASLGATGKLFVSEPGYTYNASYPYMGINLAPLTSTDIDSNNVYIKIYKKPSGAGALMTDPYVIRKLYLNSDFTIVSNVVYVNISATGANADLASSIGQGDEICIAPANRGVLGIIGAIGTSPTASVRLWINRVQEGGVDYAYDYLQMYVKNTYIKPRRVFSYKAYVAVVETSSDKFVTATSTFECNNVNNNSHFLTKDPDGTPVTVDAPIDYLNKNINGCTLYIQGAPYATVLAMTGGNNAMPTSLKWTLSRVPANNTIGNLGITDYTVFDVHLPELKNFQNITFGTSDGSGFTIGSGFTGLTDLLPDAYVGYAVTHLGKYIGIITAHDATTITLDNNTYHSTTDADIPEEASLVFIPTNAADRIDLALDNSGVAGTYKPILDLPAITDGTGKSVWARGTQQVKAKPFISPNYQIIITGLAFPETA